MKPSNNFTAIGQTNNSISINYKLSWDQMAKIRGGNLGVDPDGIKIK